MKEKLVTFETAKLAKEKGFNIPSRYYYNQKHNKIDYDLHEAQVVDGTYVNSFVNLLDYPAPTQSLLQKWLRERHRIDVTIQPFQFSRLKDPEYKYYISDHF